MLTMTTILQSKQVSTMKGNPVHIQWTTAIVTSALFGTSHFFTTVQFEGLLSGFRECIKENDAWFRVCSVLFLNKQ